ncbi:unnamed protein product [Strongylus vulgaris]|uniref:Uncharacterized protein n=1 Tax=Strongylus vulgaris TaxID=40348 RepID=A0A3P7J2U9_STRVU|nr:unnamed protein product [Strongylus vulgaris]
MLPRRNPVLKCEQSLISRLTLMVTVETVMCVLMPFLFRQYCTKRTTWFFLVVSLTLSTLLHLTLVFTTEITTHPLAIMQHNLPENNSSCWYVRSMHLFIMRSSSVYEVIQKVYYWIQTTVAIIIPTAAMLICSILIVKQFTFKHVDTFLIQQVISHVHALFCCSVFSELGEAFSQRRKCVIRMTVATTVSHLLLEGPATLTHAAVALKIDEWPLISSFMPKRLIRFEGILLIRTSLHDVHFEQRHKHLINCQRHYPILRLLAHLQKNKARKKTYLSQAGMRCSRLSRMENERSFVETRLLSNGSNL